MLQDTNRTRAAVHLAPGPVRKGRRMHVQPQKNGHRWGNGQLAFFLGFLRNPSGIGSVIPSSRFLERRVVETAGVASSRLVVELGPRHRRHHPGHPECTSPGVDPAGDRDQPRVRRLPPGLPRSAAERLPGKRRAPRGGARLGQPRASCPRHPAGRRHLRHPVLHDAARGGPPDHPHDLGLHGPGRPVRGLPGHEPHRRARPPCARQPGGESRVLEHPPLRVYHWQKPSNDSDF